MEFLNKVLKSSAPYKTLENDVKNKFLPVATSGLSGIHKAALLDALSHEIKQKILLITPNEASATEIANDLNALGTSSAVFPLKIFVLRMCSGTQKNMNNEE